MISDLQRILQRYIESGWIDVNRPAPDATAANGPHAGYLVLATNGMKIQPPEEVQVTARCECRGFRAHKMVVSEDGGRFMLADLKVGNRSQFTRDQNIALRECVAGMMGNRLEAQPDPIRWPLEVCTYNQDVVARAILAEGSEEAEFEIVLLGEVVL
jgi:hypothetical protein